MRTPAWIGLLIVVSALTAYLTRQLLTADAPASPYENVGSIREIMEGIVEPSADVLFESVAVVSNASGTTERQPRTDEEWAHVEHNALALAEAANLLKMPGRIVARPGAEDEKGPAEAAELTPEQIQTKIDADHEAWIRHANALMEQAQRALQAVRTRNVEGLYAVGGDLDAVCENCHMTYWYPNLPRGVRAR